MVYGVLMLRSDYHRVEIVTAQDNTAHLPNADYYLLTSTTQAFVIWDATLRYILWIPHQEVQQLKLLAKQSLVFSGKLSQQQKAPQQ